MGSVTPPIVIPFASGTIEISKDTDALKAFATIKKTGELKIIIEEAIQACLEKIPDSFLDRGVLSSMVDDANAGKPAEPRRIAKGRPPEDGHPGKLLLLAKPLNARPEEGDADKKGMFELHLFDNIEIDRVVGRLYPPKPGVDGLTVFGEKIPSTIGKEALVSFDDSIVLAQADQYQELKAVIPGYLERKGTSLSIRPELVIDGDVDLGVGNLDFIGKIKVKGSVGHNLRVKAKGDITIHGDVRPEASIISSAGGITVTGFATHVNFQAAGKISLHGIHHSKVETSGVVMLAKEAADTVIRSGIGVFAERAHIFGGEVLSVHGVNVNILGNPAGLKTKITLTTPAQVSSHFSDLEKRIQSHEEALKLLQAHLGPFALYPKRVERLVEPHRSKIEGLMKKMKEVEKSKLVLLGERDQQVGMGSALDDARVTVQSRAYEGSHITIGEGVTELKDTVNGPKTAIFKEHEIVWEAAQPIVLPPEPETEEKKSGKKRN